MGVAGFLYQPLSKVSPLAADIQAAAATSIKDKIKSGTLSPGVATTLEAQLRKIGLNSPECELITLPTFFSGPSKISSYKTEALPMLSSRHTCGRQKTF